MSIKFSFGKTPKSKSETVVIFTYGNKTLGASGKDIDKQSKGHIQNALKTASNFEGKSGQSTVIAMPKGSDFERVIVLGAGEAKKSTVLEIENLGANVLGTLKSVGAKHVSVIVDSVKGLGIKPEEFAAAFVTGIRLRSYGFHVYKKPESKNSLVQIDCVLDKQTAAKKLFTYEDAVAQGVYLARDVMNEPPNKLYPESYAKRLQKELKPLGVDVEILNEAQMKKMKFHSHLEVGKGSDRKSCVVIMRWHGAPVTKAKKTFSKTPIAFVGKGITFDTGGISIKPSAGMDAMKMDMGGSAAVVGLMKAIAARKSKANVVGIVALAENMPSARAYRPGDIINSMSGKTIQVDNTDAEGRLVLNDSLTYVQRTYKPKFVIDLATLTGAMMVALGHEYCGAFVNNDGLWSKLESSSQKTGEKLWRMPLDEAYRKAMEGKFSDLNNVGTMGRFGGACTAAGFLEHFIEDDTPWAHLDIAGKMEQKSDKGVTTAGGVGFGVRVLDRLISDHYE
ncbi:MAG: leucyl aminopeptidase [Pseudomonadota bacterium]